MHASLEDMSGGAQVFGKQQTPQYEQNGMNSILVLQVAALGKLASTCREAFPLIFDVTTNQ